MNSQSSSSELFQEKTRVDRTELKVLTFEEAEREDRVYWQGKTPIERLTLIRGDSVRRCNEDIDGFSHSL